MSKPTRLDWRRRDPELKREKKVYKNPIPSRQLIMQDLIADQKPRTRQQFVDWFELKDQAAEALNHRLTAMLRDGQLVRNRRGQLGVPEMMDCIRGRVEGHAEGFGFLLPDDPERDDVFLSPHQMRKVMHNDLVLVIVEGQDRRGRDDGRIVKVLEYANQTVVGRFIKEQGKSFVVPSNRRISHEIEVAKADRHQAKNGQIVIVEIIHQPRKYDPPTGRVIEILGDADAPGMAAEMALRSHDIPYQWPSQVTQQAARFGDMIRPKDRKGRKDLRNYPFVTIDGEDAKDFDDAVYAKKTPNGWHLWVAIADVSSYVKPSSPLDDEAQERGNSVYFPGRVVPMLPEALSNSLCSLNPKVERLTMVCDLLLSPDGQIRSSRFYSAVIKSKARLTYNQVADWLRAPENVPKSAGRLKKPLQDLHGVYQALSKARAKRGAIAFETHATQIIFNDQQKIERVVPVVRNVAHKMIEECMIVANVAAAKRLTKHKMPTLYRVHGGPKAESLIDLRSFLAERGLTLGGGKKPEAADFQKVLDKAEGRQDYQLIQSVLLRSMQRAVYSAKHEPHFGLALDDYAHFTSPIRRYPDLMVHRGLKHLEAGGQPKNFTYGLSDLADLGQQCSKTEERADLAARDVDDWLKCEYLRTRVGDVFVGTVVNVTGFGLFVELDDIQATGLVHVSTLKQDYYHFDAQAHCLVGEHSNRRFQLADSVQVRVVRVDMDERKIDFEYVQ